MQSAVLQGYLNQQLANVQGGGAGGNSMAGLYSPPSSTASSVIGGGELVARPMEVPSPAVLEAFKGHVRQWMDADNSIRKLQEALKEYKAKKEELSGKLTAFMARYNIEDLNTREGKLRYKVASVKPALTQKTIKEKVVELFPQARSGEELLERVFSAEARGAPVEKASLRRVRVRTVGAA
jgi:hypothetical protein